MISRIVSSSTYFKRLGHVLTRSLTIPENSTDPNLVPWGIPPFRERILEESEPMRTDCERPWRIVAIHLTRQGCRLQECNLLKGMVWSIRSNPFLKSAKKILALQLPLSKAYHNCVFQRRRYNAFTQRGIIHISNQWREFKNEPLSTILGMPSGPILGMPSGFVQRYCTDTLALIICLTIMATFLLIAMFLTRLSGTSI